MKNLTKNAETKRRTTKRGEIEIMKGRGTRQTWFYVRNVEDAKALVRMGRCSCYPTGIVTNRTKNQLESNWSVEVIANY